MWRSAPFHFRDKFRLYTIFVDEFTNFTWLIPLKHKSEFIGAFIRFYKFILCQFDVKIKILQSNEGGEFNSIALTTYLHTNGIHHQSFYPKIPKQNYKAKRKHRSITTMGLTLLLHAKLPYRLGLIIFVPLSSKTDCPLIL